MVFIDSLMKSFMIFLIANSLIDLVKAKRVCKDDSCTIYAGQPVGSKVLEDSRSTFRNTEEYPYVAALYFNDIHWCGAIIIRKDVVLTAAHCLEELESKYLQIIAGTIKIEEEIEQTAQRRSVDYFVMHEEYNKNSPMDNDIGVIFLKEPFKLNTFVQPIKMAKPQKNKTFLGEKIRIFGWGDTGGGVNSDILLYTDVRIVENEICHSRIEGQVEITEHMFCVLGDKEIESPGVGDSGGPAVIKHHKNPKNDTLIGITSFGDTNEEKVSVETSHGAVYTNVPSLRAWILDKIASRKTNKE